MVFMISQIFNGPKFSNKKQELKTAFMASKHPRFKKEVASSRHNPYGRTTDYINHIESTDNAKIGRLIRILAMLSQTKVYLIWHKKY
jgi:hypothetical protein